MIISTTGTLSQDDNFLVYHGPYAEIIPQMAEDGYQGVEMHIFDSAEIDRQELWSLLKKYNIRLTSIGTGSVCITVSVLQTRQYERQPSGIWNSIW